MRLFRCLAVTDIDLISQPGFTIQLLGWIIDINKTIPYNRVNSTCLVCCINTDINSNKCGQISSADNGFDVQNRCGITASQNGHNSRLVTQ